MERRKRAKRAMAWSVTLLTGVLLCGCGEEDTREERSYREAYVDDAERLRERMQAGECEVTETCGDLAFVDCGIAVDDAGYYIDSPTGQVLEICGGACEVSGDVCVACPPPEWDCTGG